VNIRVAVGAILSHVGEDRLYVALNARYFFVHAAQRIVRLVVIKLRHRADGTPARRRVTVLARNRQRPVRTPRGFVRMLLRVGNLVCDSWRCRCQKIMVSARKKQQRPENELGDSSRNSSPTPQLGIAVIKTAEFSALLLDRRTVATVRMYRSWPLHENCEKIAGNLWLTARNFAATAHAGCQDHDDFVINCLQTNNTQIQLMVI